MAPKRKSDGAGPDGKGPGKRHAAGPSDAADGKRPLGKQEPFNMSPDQYTESVFRAVYPLMRIIDEENPADTAQRCPDKFAGPGAMDAGALRKLMEICRPFVFDAAALHGECFSEEEGQGLHLSLFQGLSRISKPGRIQWEQLEKLQRLWLAEHGLLAEEGVRVPAGDQPNEYGEPDTHAEDLEDLLICGLGDNGAEDEEDDEEDDEDIRKSSQSSNEYARLHLAHTLEDARLHLAHRPERGTGKTGSGFSDYRMVAYDNAPFRQALLDFQRPNPKKLVAIVERNWTMSRQALQGKYQGLKYVCDEIRNHVIKGHKSAIYVIVLCNSEYTYAKVELEGWVQVLRGEIDPVSMRVYQKVASFLGVEKPQGRSELQQQLLYGQLEHLSDYDQPLYPDGIQLVGNVFTTTKWFPLPNAKDKGFFTQVGSRKFYEGLARCARGDKILSYTTAMVEQAANDYEERRDRKMKYLE